MVTNVLGTEHRSLFEPAEERSRLNQTFDRRKTKSRHLTKFPVHIFKLRDALTLDTQMASGLKIERTGTPALDFLELVKNVFPDPSVLASV